MNKNSLKILPVKKSQDTTIYPDVHENLLKCPFRIAIVGSSKSGKSNLLMNYLRKEFYGECFDKIIIFSPNLCFDKTTRHLLEMTDEEDRHLSYSDKIINEIIEKQKAIPVKMLIIADDLIALGCNPTSKIFTSATYMRHLDISIIYLSQSYKGAYSLPPVTRNNLDGIILFRQASDQQIDAFCEDMSGMFLNKKNVKNMLEKCNKKPFNFAFFNYRDLNVWHNHDEKIWEKYNENGDFNTEWK